MRSKRRFLNWNKFVSWLSFFILEESLVYLKNDFSNSKNTFLLEKSLCLNQNNICLNETHHLNFWQSSINLVTETNFYFELRKGRERSNFFNFVLFSNWILALLQDIDNF